MRDLRNRFVLPALAAASVLALAQSAALADAPKLVATYGNWGVYVAGGDAKTCYAMSQPTKRDPEQLRRGPGYVFVSTRASEGMRNEVSVIMGFGVREGSAPEARIGDARFALVAKGANLWVRNAAEEAPMIEAMRRGATMTLHVTSGRGNDTVDHYSLSGVTAALGRVAKECG